MEKDLSSNWKVNTPQLLKLLIEQSPNGTVLYQPVRIFKNLLIKLAERALEINDKELNEILLRLNLIEVDVNKEELE